MARVAVGAPAFLHLCFQDMSHTLLNDLSHVALVLPERVPVVVIEVFDDLEGPASE
ncbi:hypothetical protein BH10ACT9_BH10ACT9_53370 [soil metagenome]